MGPESSEYVREGAAEALSDWTAWRDECEASD
jgi:hypothetical protein